jgi:hypothetical protein
MNTASTAHIPVRWFVRIPACALSCSYSSSIDVGMSFFRRTIPSQNYPADRTAYTAACLNGSQVKNVCCTLNNPSIRLEMHGLTRALLLLLIVSEIFLLI